MRDSYRKSKIKAKSGAGASRSKTYIYASQLHFIDKIFDEKETDDTLSQNIDDSENYGCDADVTVNDNQNPTVPSDAAPAEKPTSSSRKPPSKKRKMDPVELEMIAALKEKPNRHLSFFKGLLPSLEDFDEIDTIDFQMEVLKIVKQIRQRKHPLSSTSGTSYGSPCSTPLMTSPSDTPPMAQNLRLICLQSSSNESPEYALHTL